MNYKFSDRRALHANKPYIVWLMIDFVFMIEDVITQIFIPRKVEDKAYKVTREELGRITKEIIHDSIPAFDKLNRNKFGFINSIDYNEFVDYVGKRYTQLSSYGARLVAGRCVMAKNR